jgi:hypothetical protein
MARTASSVAERNDPEKKKVAKSARQPIKPARKTLITVPARKKIELKQLKEGEPPVWTYITPPEDKPIDEKELQQDNFKALCELNIEMLREGDISSSSVWQYFFYDDKTKSGTKMF